MGKKKKNERKQNDKSTDETRNKHNDSILGITERRFEKNGPMNPSLKSET
jgi:hypothetical protein